MLRALLVLALVCVPSAWSQEALREAAQALEKEDYATAAEWLEKALEEDPGDTGTRFHLAFAYTQLQQDEKAIEQYEKVLAGKPDLLQARSNLSLVLLRQKRPADAVPHLRALAEARPGEFQPHFYLAHALEEAGEAAAAAEAYRRAAGLEPGNADAVLGLGRTLAQAGRYAEAAPHYRKAAELNPEFRPMLLELAEMLERNEKGAEALQLYQSYLEAHPGEVAVQERAGMLLLEAERYQEAAALLEKAAQASPSAANQAALAEAYLRLEDQEAAKESLAAAIELDPRDGSLRLRHANLLLREQQYHAAAREYLAALERKPESQEAWNGLAFSLYQAENYPGALKALEEAGKRGEEKPGHLFLRAIIEDKLQLYEQAKQSYGRFLAAAPGMEKEEFQARQRLKAIEVILSKR